MLRSPLRGSGALGYAPDTPEPIATVEKPMDAGKTHHNCENVSTDFPALLRVIRGLKRQCSEMPPSPTHSQVTESGRCSGWIFGSLTNVIDEEKK